MSVSVDYIECLGGKWQAEIHFGIWTAYTNPLKSKEECVKAADALVDKLKGGKQ